MAKLVKLFFAILVIGGLVFCFTTSNTFAAEKWWTVDIIETYCVPGHDSYAHWVRVEHATGGWNKWLRFNSKDMLAVLLTADSLNEQVKVVFEDTTNELLQVRTINTTN